MSDKNWLPSKFIDEMKEMLGDEFDDFLASYDEDYYRGIRCNTLKITPSEFEKKVPSFQKRLTGYRTVIIQVKMSSLPSTRIILQVCTISRSPVP